MNKFLLIMGLSLLAACGRQTEKPPGPRPVWVIQLGEQAGQKTLGYSGEIHARQEADLGFRVGGKLDQRLVELGDTVKAGQALARLDSSDTSLALSDARARLAEAQASLGNARAELARAEKLVAEKFLSQSALDSRRTQVQTSAAKVHEAEAQVRLAGNQARYTTLVADRPGVITAVSAEPGQVVSPGQHVLRIAYAGEREVQVRVGEAEAAKIRPGQIARVKLWAQPDLPLQGRVREISPAADSNRTYLVKVSLPASAPVRLGMTASIVLSGSVQQAGNYILPMTALTQTPAGPAIFRLDRNNRVQPVPVRLVAYRDEGMQIDTTLAPGTFVAAAGTYKLHPGQQVEPIPYRGPQATPPLDAGH
jgi:RND family efflux transporter MFP subunit